MPSCVFQMFSQKFRMRQIAQILIHFNKGSVFDSKWWCSHIFPNFDQVSTFYFELTNYKEIKDEMKTSFSVDDGYNLFSNTLILNKGLLFYSALSLCIIYTFWILFWYKFCKYKRTDSKDIKAALVWGRPGLIFSWRTRAGRGPENAERIC